jgi:hypothetical protein
MTDFEKIAEISNFMDIRPMGAEFYRADRQTEGRIGMTKRIVAFHNFVNSLEKNSGSVFIMTNIGGHFLLAELCCTRSHSPASFSVAYQSVSVIS